MYGQRANFFIPQLATTKDQHLNPVDLEHINEEYVVSAAENKTSDQQIRS